MSRSFASLAIALMALVALCVIPTGAIAQVGSQPSGYQVGATGTTDVQTSTWTGFDWSSVWGARFTSPSAFGWGRSLLLSKFTRATDAVLRERRGLLR